MKADQQTEEQILATLRGLSEAVSNRSFDSAIKLFAEGEQTLVVAGMAGETAKGIEEFRDALLRVFSGPIGFSYRWDDYVVDVSGETAWIYANGQVETCSAAGCHKHPYRITGVLRRVDSEWKWVLYHGSEPAG
jgi:ketosteroid isomerase-like protein